MRELRAKGIESEIENSIGNKELNHCYGSYDGNGLRFAVVVSRYNDQLTNGLLEAFMASMAARGVSSEQIFIYWVPGAYEIPTVLSKLAAKGGFHALVALGAVMEGATNHAQIISQEIAHAVSQLSVKYQLPIIDTVVTSNTMEEARERCLTGEQSRGHYAAEAALEMASLLNKI